MRIFILLLAGCLTMFAQEPAQPTLNQDPELNDLSASTALGGMDVLNTIRNADTVTVQRIDSIPDNKGPRVIMELGTPFPVPATQAAALKAAFGRGETYLSPSKVCQFRANVRYVFATAKDKIVIILCFGCGEMEVWRDKDLVSFGPFDGGYGHILDITKQLFPKDEFLAAFSERIFRERAMKMQVERPDATPEPKPMATAPASSPTP